MSRQVFFASTPALYLQRYALVAGDVYDGVFLCGPVSHEMSTTSSCIFFKKGGHKFVCSCTWHTEKQK